MNPNPEAAQSSNYGGPQEERPISMVLLCGLATTLLALGGVYFLERHSDTVIMGWYLNYVLPIGAILVGVVAALGYGLASWFSGIKITQKLFWIVLLFQFIAYFAAQYIEFKGLHLSYPNGEAVSFFTYYDYSARHFAWKQDNGTSGQTLGVYGYFFRALEILGFVGGGLLVPLVLRKSPYCAACQLYMKTRQLATVPASVPARKVKKKDEAGQAAYLAEQQQALDAGNKTITGLQELAAGNNGPDFQKKLAELQPGKKAAAKLPSRFSLQLVHCKRCYAGQYIGKLMTGQGKQLKQTEVLRADLHPEFVRAIVQ